MKKANIRKFAKENPYVSIGNSRFIKTEGILGIFDTDRSTISPVTRKFLRKSEKRGVLVTSSLAIPKSTVLYDDGERENVYLVQFAPSVLLKRTEDAVSLETEEPEENI